MLGKMRRAVSKDTAILVYKQTILPVLEYCGYLYNGVTLSQHKRLQLTQNRCLRTCLNVKFKYHITDLHSDTNVDLLCIRYDLQLLLLLYKYLNDINHQPNLLGIVYHTPDLGGKVTRSTGTGILAYPPSIKKGYRKSPLYRGIHLWNQLNVSCRLANSKEIFRVKAKAKLVRLHLLKLKQ